ncbi:MAG TPA: hypothetical protein PLK37_02910 [Terricaulis sp.]|nr:hypothetical protein [Terricaulis sp.]
MIELLILTLFQAIAGDPAPAAAPTAHEHGVTESAAAAAPAAESAPAAEAAPAERQYRRERVCREVEITGRRMPQRVCQNVMVPVEDGEQAD